MVIVSTSIADKGAVGFKAVDMKAGGPVGNAGVSSTIGEASTLSLQRMGCRGRTHATVYIRPEVLSRCEVKDALTLLCDAQQHYTTQHTPVHAEQSIWCSYKMT